jgi:hypothetical protein
MNEQAGFGPRRGFVTLGSSGSQSKPQANEFLAVAKAPFID